jgi:hypothetical protein
MLVHSIDSWKTAQQLAPFTVRIIPSLDNGGRCTSSSAPAHLHRGQRARLGYGRIPSPAGHTVPVDAWRLERIGYAVQLRQTVAKPTRVGDTNVRTPSLADDSHTGTRGNSWAAAVKKVLRYHSTMPTAVSAVATVSMNITTSW